MSGRSAVWLARFVRDEEVGGSNPLAPTIQDFKSPLGRLNKGFAGFFVSFLGAVFLCNVCLKMPVFSYSLQIFDRLLTDYFEPES